MGQESLARQIELSKKDIVTIDTKMEILKKLKKEYPILDLEFTFILSELQVTIRQEVRYLAQCYQKWNDNYSTLGELK